MVDWTGKDLPLTLKELIVVCNTEKITSESQRIKKMLYLKSTESSQMSV